MATITTINATDKVGDSRADINTNFSNLNTDKLEAVSVSAEFTGDGTSGDPLTLASTYLEAGKETGIALTSSTNVLTLNPAYNCQSHLLTENTALALPVVTGLATDDWLRIDFFLKVDAGGTYAMTFASGWMFDGGTAPTLSATAGAVDHLVVTVTKSFSTTVYSIGLAAADIKVPA